MWVMMNTSRGVHLTLGKVACQKQLLKLRRLRGILRGNYEYVRPMAADMSVECFYEIEIELKDEVGTRCERMDNFDSYSTTNNALG